MLWIFFVIVIMLAFNAFYVAAEFATVSARRSSIQQAASDGHRRARALLPILEDAHKLDRYIATCQIGITLSSIVLGAFGQAALTLKLTPYVALWAGISNTAAFSFTAGGVLIGLTGLQMIFGELIPKSVSLQYPSKIALLTYLPMRWSTIVFSWLIALLNGSGILLLKILGVEQSAHRHIHSPAEIEVLIAESRDGGALEPDEHERLKRALALSSKKASELLVPRTRIVDIDADASSEEILEIISKSPYTRFPVYRDSTDNIIGMLHAKDAITHMVKHGCLPPIASILRSIPTISATVSADQILVKLKKHKAHQAVVVDEHGGVDGIVTLGDVLSEVMGAVGDEFKPATSSPETLPDGRLRVFGHTRLDDAQGWMGVLWQGDCHTIAGKILEMSGSIPEVGEHLCIEGVDVEIEAVKQNTIVSVLVTPLQDAEDSSDDA